MFHNLHDDNVKAQCQVPIWVFVRQTLMKKLPLKTIRIVNKTIARNKYLFKHTHTQQLNQTSKPQYTFIYSVWKKTDSVHLWKKTLFHRSLTFNRHRGRVFVFISSIFFLFCDLYKHTETSMRSFNGTNLINRCIYGVRYIKKGRFVFN